MLDQVEHDLNLNDAGGNNGKPRGRGDDFCTPIPLEQLARTISSRVVGVRKLSLGDRSTVLPGRESHRASCSVSQRRRGAWSGVMTFAPRSIWDILSRYTFLSRAGGLQVARVRAASTGRNRQAIATPRPSVGTPDFDRLVFPCRSHFRTDQGERNALDSRSMGTLGPNNGRHSLPNRKHDRSKTQKQSKRLSHS